MVKGNIFPEKALVYCYKCGKKTEHKKYKPSNGIIVLLVAASVITFGVALVMTLPLLIWMAIERRMLKKKPKYQCKRCGKLSYLPNN